MVDIECKENSLKPAKAYLNSSKFGPEISEITLDFSTFYDKMFLIFIKKTIKEYEYIFDIFQNIVL